MHTKSIARHLTVTLTFAAFALCLPAFGQARLDAGWTATLNPSDLPAAQKLHPVLLERLENEAGPAKAWVFFTDKGLANDAEAAAAIQEVAANFNSRSVQRRMLRGAHAGQPDKLFDATDLPLAKEYVDAVGATGATLVVQSKWLNAVSVRATREQADLIAALPCVDRLEPVGRARHNWPVEINENVPALPSGDPRDLIDYGNSQAQLAQMNLIALHDAGHTGEGVIVGILDTGFNRVHEAFNYPGHEVQVIAEWDFINNDPNTGIEPGDPSGQHNHGTLILGCIGSYFPGKLVGGAYNARFILCKTEDTAGEYQAEEDFYVAGLEFIDLNGGDMSTSSLGYIDWYNQSQLNGLTAVTTIGVNISTGKGIHHCNAAGNEGHDSNPNTSHLIAPADAFQGITCGAVDSSGNIASFSSDGPTADKRVKPEIVARGVSTHTVSSSGTSGYTTASGTSLSTPLVACSVACLTGARPYWDVDRMRKNLFETADYYLQHNTFDPLYIYGYGLVNAFSAYQRCSDAGTVQLDAAVYSCDSTVGIVVSDCGLDKDPNQIDEVVVTAESDSEPSGEQVTLVETSPDSAEFTGAIDTTDTNAPGVLLVAHRDTITVTYLDEDNGQGVPVLVTADADVDCQEPAVSDVEVTGISYDRAVISFVTDEPVMATIHYGTECNALNQQVSTAGYEVSPSVELTGLAQYTPFYFAVEAQDVVQNATYDDNGGNCYDFKTLHGPEVAYGFYMDTNPGWTTQGQWAWGQPTGGGGNHGNPDPTAGHTGPNVYGYNLGGDYDNNMPEHHLTTPALDLSDAQQTVLRFWRYLGVERSLYDHAHVRISTNGTTWTNIWANPDEEIADAEWVQMEYDISAIADGEPTVYLRWTMGVTDIGWTYCGWNLDDIEVWAILPLPFLVGDVNCDDVVDFGDINPFVLALTDPGGYQQQFPDCPFENRDINADGKVNFDDINPFVALLTQP